jgi:hypothetical protein
MTDKLKGEYMIFKKALITYSLLFFMIFFPLRVFSQVILKSSVFSNGIGVMTGTNNSVVSTVGQPFTGVSSNSTTIHQAGFWTYVNVITGIESKDDLLPREFELMQNYPNPFNPTTKIKYAIPQATHVRIEVYNVLGQRVRTLLDEEKAPGYYTVNFEAGSLASGFYIYRLETSGGFNAVKKMIITK